MIRSLRSGLALLILAMVAGCGEGEETAHEEAEHDHAEGVAVTVWTEKSELFFEYPTLIAGEPGGPWAVHVTRLEGFDPVTEGVLTLAFRAPDGTVYTTRSEAPVRAGIFSPAPTLPHPGTYELVVDVASSQLSDRIPAGTVQVYADEEDAHIHESHPDGISFLKEQQWVIDFDVVPVDSQQVMRSVEASGEIVPAADRVVEVSAPVSGLARAGMNRGTPAEGERVGAGRALAILSPATGDDTYARAKSDIERLSREVERLGRLFEAEAIPEKRLIDARHELEVARTVLETLGGTERGYDYVIRSPISGVVQRRHFTPGEYVGPGELLFEIVNMNVVWLRVHLPAQHTMLANAAGGATFTVEGSMRRFRPSALVSTGSALDPETRTLPVTYAVDNGDGNLRLGMFARVMLDVGSRVGGVAIPADAVQSEDGVPVAYVQVGGETFQRRPLILGPSDGVYTIVEQGVSAGERVVTRGAYEVYLASLNTEEVGGHGHPH